MSSEVLARSAATHVAHVETLVAAGRRTDALVAAHDGVVEHGEDVALLEVFARLAAHERRWPYACAARARLTRLQPHDPRHWRALAHAASMAGDEARAREAIAGWRRAAPHDAIAQHLDAAYASSNPDRPARGYVAALFDGCSTTFDAHLAALGYQAPDELVARIVARLGGRPAANAADLGCGTGLAGALLRPHVATMCGVDISRGMLARAHARGCYDRLWHGDLERYLQRTPASHDLLVSVDALIYLGGLGTVCAAAHESLRPGGTFACTLEADDAGEPEPAGHRLCTTGRYVHHEAAVRTWLHDARFGDVTIDRIVLRRERGRDVTGLAVLAGRAR